MTFDLIRGDCREVMATLDADSIDAVVCDPPYELVEPRSVVSFREQARAGGRTDEQKAARRGGFMGKKWDGSGVAFDPATWAEALRVLKPGAHLVAFGAPRTYHRLATAIEDAGFEIRDSLMWLFGSGFPKSLDVSKAIDKAAGVDREDKFEGAFGRRAGPTGNKRCDACGKWLISGSPCKCPRPQDAPATPDAERWSGWGTALKPAYEPVVLARKPLRGTVAANVLAYGTGALNIDGTRIDAADKTKFPVGYGRGFGETYAGDDYSRTQARTADANPGARWPANVLLDADAARQLDAMSGERPAGSAVSGEEPSAPVDGVYGDYGRVSWEPYADRGGASRFFYTAKASRSEREFGLDDLEAQRRSDGREKDIENPRLRVSARRNDHPTVKPVDVMRWLCRLITPPDGTILDPFCGSGSTGMAALDEGFRFVGIDLDERYLEIARRRIARRHLIEPLPQRSAGQGVLL